ncbi:MAG: hypothetical protein ABJB97_04035, partial [Acidobacteriota bacterium]
MKTLFHICLYLNMAARGHAAVAQPPQIDAKTAPFEHYAGVYESNSKGFLSMAIFDPGDGQNRFLFTDFATGNIRVLAPAEKDVFTAGPSFLIASPVESRFTFHRNGRDKATSVLCHRDGIPDQIGTKMNCRREAVTFRNGSVTLSGTLVSPAVG